MLSFNDSVLIDRKRRTYANKRKIINRKSPILCWPRADVNKNKISVDRQVRAKLIQAKSGEAFF